MFTSDDILFRHRNRNYGAYAMRRRQVRVLFYSLIISLSLFSSIFVSMLVYYAIPEELALEDWVEYDNAVISNPYQAEYFLEEPVGGPEKEENSVTEISDETSVADMVIAESQTQAGDTAGQGADSISGKGKQTGDTTDRTAFNVSKDPGIVYDLMARLDVLPMFPGGEKARQEFFHSQITYPKFALDNKIQGVVYINFIVERDSSISNIQVIQGIGAGCDDEALKAVRKMPPWTPGKKNGESVRVLVTLPLTFSLATRN